MLFARKGQDPVVVALEEAGMSGAVARRLAAAGTPVLVRPGVPLCRKGELGAEAFVLVSGEAVVRLPGKDRTVAAGEVFGELAALNPRARRNATVETTEKSVVLAFDVRTFRQLASEMTDVLVPQRSA